MRENEKKLLAQTADEFEWYKEAADGYIKLRNQRLLINKKKEQRHFTRAEAVAYLDLAGRTLDKYSSAANIDPRKHEDSAWLVNIEEIYAIRNALPKELRKAPAFERGKERKLQVVTIKNQKGGVGKTVSAATLASGLATEFHEEYRVGLIDMDGQATLSMYYAPLAASLECLSAGDLISGNFELDEGETRKDAISSAFLPTTIPNLRILPATQSDRAIEGWFHKNIISGDIKNPYSILKDIIEEVEDQFDIIIIDTPPSLSYASFNAYYAATSVVFPVTIAENDLDATCSYFKYVREVWSLIEDAGHDGYHFMKTLLTNHKDGHTTSELQMRFSSFFSSRMYSKEFRQSEAVRQSSSLMSTVFDMSKSEYPKTKSRYTVAHQNAFEVVCQLKRDIDLVWRIQEGKE